MVQTTRNNQYIIKLNNTNAYLLKQITATMTATMKSRTPTPDPTPTATRKKELELLFNSCFTTYLKVIFYAPAIRTMWRGNKCYPCPCVRPSVRLCVRPSVIKIWCPLNNFLKTASIQFKFGMLIYNIKTQVEFDLGYNQLIFDGVMGLI